MKDEITIDGVTYVKKPTEPVKRERKQYLINDKNEILACWQGNKFLFGGCSYYMGDNSNTAELFDGEIIISKEDFERAVERVGFDKHINEYVPFTVERIMRELFK